MDNRTYFQAIAWITAELIEKTELIDGKKKKVRKLLYKGKEYDCKCATISRGGFVSNQSVYSKWAANKGAMIFGVYPRWVHFPSRNKEYLFYFEIFSWGDLPEGKLLNKFYISGIWQFISVYSRPIISVYRNEQRNEKDNLKINHCPVFWRDSNVKPYRYNPNNTNNTNNKYFISSICDFDSRYNSLILKQMIHEPSLVIPPYKKPQKVRHLKSQKSH